MRVLIADRFLASPGRVAMSRMLVGALVVLVVSTALAMDADLYGWEERLTEWAFDLPSSLNAALRVVMQAGNRLAVAAAALLFLLADRPRRAGVVLIAGWGAWSATMLLKWVVGRPRPSAEVLGFSPEEYVSGSGYPSSHTAIAVALALVVVTAVGVPRPVKAVAVAAAALTGLARIHLVVHWPLDVIGGAAVGLVVAGLVVVVLDPAPVLPPWPGVGRWPPPPPTTVAPTLGAEVHPDESLRVATFNIRNGRAFDRFDSWPFRRRATAAMISSLDADLAGLQEVYAFQRRWLERRLPDRVWIGAGRTDGVGRGEQCPITWRPSRLELEDWGVRWFSDRPDDPGSSFEGAQFPRIATMARFCDRGTDFRFGVVNAHLDSHRQVDRVRSAELLVGWLAGYDLPWLVLGDMNDGPDSQVLGVLQAGGYRSVGPSDGRGTIHQFTGRVDGGRIDHVLFSDDWSAGPPDILTVSSGRLPSDHWPLVVDLRRETS